MGLKVGSWLEDLAIRIGIKKLFNKIDMNKGSWKTSAYGILAALGTMGTQVMAVLDNDPTTQPDIKVFITAAATAWAIFKLGQSARDKDVSTEQETAAMAAKGK